MGTKVLLINVNHCKQAQDLLAQHLAEWEIGIGVVSEPYNVPDSPFWHVSEDGRAAIYWNKDYLHSSCSLFLRGSNFVALSYGDTRFISCYIPPKIRVNVFREILSELEEAIRTAGDKVVLCGDFNSKSPLWGSRVEDWRGKILWKWANEVGLRIANVGKTPTCVRPQGTSVVDITWVSEGLKTKVTDWRVEQNMVTLSDHNSILFSIEEARGNRRRHRHRRRSSNHPPTATSPRWNLKKLDEDILGASLVWSGAVQPANLTSAEDWATWINRAMTNACDASMPRSRGRNPRRSAYWWDSSIADLRERCVRTRRHWTHLKSRQNRREITDELANREAAYKEARYLLKTSIIRVKADAWRDLIKEIDRNPWGLHYRLVMNRLRRSDTGLTETLDAETLNQLLDSLFPNGETRNLYNRWQDLEWNDSWNISAEETRIAVRGRNKTNVAPGMDGIKSAVWKKIPIPMIKDLTKCLNACLRDGVFPTSWKEARLVLISKAGSLMQTEANGLPKARPICLLNEVGKVLERIIADRINTYMRDHPDSNLSPEQFGFRRCLSTCDAILEVRRIINGATSAGNYAIALGLDIKNAFNSIPWMTIRKALADKEFPDYLRRILDAYLAQRTIVYPTISGILAKREVQAGVPQGSVLGPLLWNITYDEILRVDMEEGCSVICYATLIVATAASILETRRRASAQASRVLRSIRRLGLTVAIPKTEAVLFHRPEQTPAVLPHVWGGDRAIQTQASMTYLGIKLDSVWSFLPHFHHVEEKANRVARSLSRLMPNLRGPGESKRRLYAHVLHSVMLYGAPVWGETLMISPRAQMSLRRAQRAMAQRVIAAYRTTSYVAATLLARTPPIHLLASKQSRVFSRLRDLARRGELTPEAERTVRHDEEASLREEWLVYISGQESEPERRTREAITPIFGNWLDRPHGSLSFRMTQLISGHGCFSEYLNRMGKLNVDTCFHCGEGPETAQHTLQHCKAWSEQRAALRETIGDDLTIRAVVDRITESKEAWNALHSFAETVLQAKEEEERRRQNAEAALRRLRRLRDSDPDDDDEDYQDPTPSSSSSN